MSFFQKDQTEKNLQYDDIAFLHFLLTVTLVSVIILGYLVYKKIQAANVKSIKNYDRLKKCGLYTKQISNESVLLKREHLTSGFWVMVVLFVGSIFVIGALVFFIGTHQTQMIGFDPHEILGISPDATVNQIKKAYRRKLALEHHPDRNPNNPQAQAKFIMISKSYQCLTDQEKRENCLKFGNPDGAASFQVGIGLPKFLISKQNQFIILPIVFALLLIVVPMIFINWTNKLKTKHKVGLQVANYPVLHQFFQPNFSPVYGFYLLTVIKQTQTDKKLQQDVKKKFIEQLKEKKFINLEFVEKNYNEGQFYMLYKIYRHLAYKQVDAQVSRLLPQLINSLIHFGCFYARKINHEKFLLPNALPITWIGTKHLHNLIAFSRFFYNGSLYNSQQTKAFDLLDMPKEDREISLKYPVTNLYQLVTDQQKLKQHLGLFPQHHREYINKQLNQIPHITLDIKMKIGDKVSYEFTTEDQVDIYFKVERKNSPSGYCYLPHLPYLKEQKFYLMFIYQGNLIFFDEITFEAGKDTFVGKFPYRQTIPRQMQFFALLLSDCREGIDLQTELHFIVKQATQEQKTSKIEFNEQDLQIEKLPKNGFQKALSMQVQNPSDNELSSDEEDNKTMDDSKVEVRNGKKYMRMERESDCHDCGHDH